MEIVIETFRAHGEPSSSGIRARPVLGQGLPPQLRVECSKHIRRDYPVGSLFKVWAKLTDREGGAPYLYTNYRDSYERVSPAQAQKFIAEKYGRRS